MSDLVAKSAEELAEAIRKVRKEWEAEERPVVDERAALQAADELARAARDLVDTRKKNDAQVLEAREKRLAASGGKDLPFIYDRHDEWPPLLVQLQFALEGYEARRKG